MALFYFEELNKELFSGYTVIVDIDGTLVPDGERTLAEETHGAFSSLQQNATPYLASNRDEPGRNQAFALALRVPLLHESLKKPSPALIWHTKKHLGGEDVAVIGDKYLTDGIFALLLGAQFVRVRRKESGTESLWTKMIYTLDSVVGRVAAWCSAMRVYHSIKNLLVFLPLFFVGNFFVPALLLKATAAFAAFSLLSSAVYLFNDLVDRAQDRSHFRKRFRPVVRGEVETWEAILLTSGLLASLGLLLYFVVPEITVVLLAYLLLNVGYGFGLKHIPIVDIVLVALFYLLRIHAGGIVTETAISPWLNLVAFFLSLFVITGKRLAEFSLPYRRKVLEGYTADFLSRVLVIATALSLSVYGAYSVLAHDSQLLVFTSIPFAVGVLRYLQLSLSSPEAENPELLLLSDRIILGSVAVWGAMFLGIVYL